MKRFFITSFVIVALALSMFSVSEAASTKIVLAVWTDDQPTWEKVIELYEEQYPDVEVEWQPLPIGMPAYRESGETFPQKTLEALSELDGWILGPIGHMAYPRDDPKAVNPHPIIRRQFDMISNIRPARSFPKAPKLNIPPAKR